mmetsp:Transcript_1931/g.2216  ORF Transcript_1931/g.2216 Transcript_1931/m.2216 type:complete len:293 (+) Transcript_1931:135-1013(+)
MDCSEDSNGLVGQRKGSGDKITIDILHIVLLRQCLSFLTVQELLMKIELVSKQLRQASAQLTGRCKLSPTRLALPSLMNRLRDMRNLRTIYDSLSVGTHHTKASLFKGLNKYRSTKPFREKHLVHVDDEELLQMFRNVKFGREWQLRAAYVTFHELLDASDQLNILIQKRKEYLEQFCRPKIPANFEGERCGEYQLTKYGEKVCEKIFDLFDKNQDRALCWNELSELNNAAGIPLTRSAFSWVQEKFETDENGFLTKNGYYALFIDNFKLSPHLMYRDLHRLTKIVDMENPW